MKSIVEINDKLKFLIDEKEDEININSFSEEYSENYNIAWIEGLNLLLNLYKQNIFNNDIICIAEFYLKSLTHRYNRDLELEHKDITSGWLKGSIDCFTWFLY